MTEAKRVAAKSLLSSSSGDALQCYTCMGSNNEDCNRQGSKLCPSFSDACAVVVGHDSESSNIIGVAFPSLALSHFVWILPYMYIFKKKKDGSRSLCCQFYRTRNVELKLCYSAAHCVG